MEMRVLYNLPMKELFEEILVKSPMNHRTAKQIDIRKRVDLMQLQAVKDFNSETFYLHFDMRQGENTLQARYLLASCYHPLHHVEEHEVRAIGDKHTIAFLVSVLHEIGHAIDFKKRSFKTAARGGKANCLRCERNAWILGLQWGIARGIVSREEVAEHYTEMIMCLASYYRYYDESFDEFDRVQKKIFEKVMK